MKKKIEYDSRIKKKPITWLHYLSSYIVLLILSAGQALILAKQMGFNVTTKPEYIFGMLGYWAIVSAVLIFVTRNQVHNKFDTPMRRLSKAAKQVAAGDFSVYIEPFHTSDKSDYIDVMFEDFNKMVKELGSIETLKNDFITNVSHEIKTPLSVIQSYASMIKKETLEPERRLEYADIIISASGNLTILITNILKLNRLENQEIALVAEPYDLCRQLSECVLAFASVLEQKNIEFEADIEERVMLLADEGMLEIAWNNILSNAIKFTPSGGKITLTQTSDTDTVTITVTDNGCGMDEETTKHIFDKFYQGDTSHSGEGNGLGLALTLRVIELSGGSISVQSEPGIGSIFNISLKIK